MWPRADTNTDRQDTDERDHNTLNAKCDKTVAPPPSSKLEFKLDTRYRVSHAVAISRKLTAGWLSCCYSRWATTQYMTPAVCTLTESMRREEEENEKWK